MPLDLVSANAQVMQLTQQAASARYASGRLSLYQERLKAAWSGEEAKMYGRAALELAIRCETLERELTALRGEIAQEIEEIIAAEEAVPLP